MSRLLAEEWRSRLATLCDEVAAQHGAHVERVDGRALTYWPARDVYVLLLVWPDRPDEVAVELDAEEIALFDEIARQSLRTLVEERIVDAIRTKLGHVQLPLATADSDVSWRIPGSTLRSK